MFTGIIEEIGHLRHKDIRGASGSLSITCNHILSDCHIGDSIATNGVCLTVTDIGHDYYCCDVMAETLRYSSLGALSIGDPVNLERALAANGRFGGHIVSGHIDGIGTIRSIRREGNAIWYEIEASRELLTLMVPKGSITIDGISLTIAQQKETTFFVSIIPHTLQVTALSTKQVSDVVNLECDIIAKYMHRWRNDGEPSRGITRDFLQAHGF